MFYKVHGHVIPYIVVARCGKLSKKARPRESDKRDSQMVLLRLLGVISGITLNLSPDQERLWCGPNIQDRKSVV